MPRIFSLGLARATGMASAVVACRLRPTVGSAGDPSEGRAADVVADAASSVLVVGLGAGQTSCQTPCRLCVDVPKMTPASEMTVMNEKIRQPVVERAADSQTPLSGSETSRQSAVTFCAK